MGLWDALKNLTKPSSDDYLDDELEEETPRSPFARQESRSYTDYAEAPAVQDNSVRRTFLNSMRGSGEKSAPAGASGERGSVSLGGSSQQPMKLLVMQPEKFEDAAGIADSMRTHNSIVLNLEAISKEEARRLVDFISGAAYIQGGRIRRIAANTYIVTPANVDLSGDILGKLDGSATVDSYF